MTAPSPFDDGTQSTLPRAGAVFFFFFFTERELGAQTRVSLRGGSPRGGRSSRTPLLEERELVFSASARRSLLEGVFPKAAVCPFPSALFLFKTIQSNGTISFPLPPPFFLEGFFSPSPTGPYSQFFFCERDAAVLLFWRTPFPSFLYVPCADATAGFSSFIRVFF